MLAILLSEKMDPFYQNILSFPTIFFSILLTFCIFFWLIAILGFLDISFLDLPDPDFDFSGDSDAPTTPDAVAGIILKLGLNGVPLTLVVSLVALFGWFISYYIVHFSFGYVPDGIIQYAVGVVVLLFSAYCGAVITGRLIKPLRPLFKKMEQNIEKVIMGQTVVVRTSRVDNDFGEALLEDGGAGLILKIRSTGENKHTKGDKVVLIEYIKNTNVYRVVSEQEFTGL